MTIAPTTQLDSTAKIQAMIDAAAGSTVTLPVGTYYTSAPLRITKPMRFTGSGPGTAPGGPSPT